MSVSVKAIVLSFFLTAWAITAGLALEDVRRGKMLYAFVEIGQAMLFGWLLILVALS